GTDDCHGHGTHVAGTVGGATYGVAKGVSLVAVRVLNCAGSGTWSGVIAGIDWVTSHRIAPAVANMSLGGGASQSVDDAVTGSIDAGVTYAIAAGNSSDDACKYSPARTPAAITVGATTSSDARASYSNFGTCLDVFAPGSGITSAWNTSNTATNTISGTSMASPHVAGVAALVLEAGNQSPADVRNAIVTNATAGVVSSAGSGSPNLLLYSGFVGGGSPPPPPPPSDVVIHVQNLSGSSAAVNRAGKWRATVTITVGDAGNLPVSGVVVTGFWSNGASGSTSCTTGASGSCSVTSGNASQNITSVSWNVSSLSLSGASYDAGANSANSITVAKP
ncbi:MAG TPA: S8 family peptidase, partial [Gemmatimonadales bacterium]